MKTRLKTIAYFVAIFFVNAFNYIYASVVGKSRNPISPLEGDLSADELVGDIDNGIAMLAGEIEEYTGDINPVFTDFDYQGGLLSNLRGRAINAIKSRFPKTAAKVDALIQRGKDALGSVITGRSMAQISGQATDPAAAIVKVLDDLTGSAGFGGVGALPTLMVKNARVITRPRSASVSLSTFNYLLREAFTLYFHPTVLKQATFGSDGTASFSFSKTDISNNVMVPVIRITLATNVQLAQPGLAYGFSVGGSTISGAVLVPVDFRLDRENVVSPVILYIFPATKSNDFDYPTPLYLSNAIDSTDTMTVAVSGGVQGESCTVEMIGPDDVEFRNLAASHGFVHIALTK